MLGVDEKGHGRTLIGHSLMADADLGSKLAIAPLKGQMNWHTWKDSIEYFLIEKACGNTVRLSPPFFRKAPRKNFSLRNTCGGKGKRCTLRQ